MIDQDSDASELFQRPPEADYLEQWRATLASQTQLVVEESQSYLVFRLADQVFGLSSSLVNEVLPPLPVRALPNRSQEVVQGLVNLHGRLQICVSLAALLAPGQPAGASKRLLVVNLHGDHYLTPVQDALGIHRFQAADIDQPPASARHLSGLCSLDGEMVGLLDSSSLRISLRRSVSR